MHLLLVLIFVLTWVYWYLTRIHNYWAKQNVPTVPGCVPGFGHMLPSLLMRETLKDLADRAYRGFADSSVVGFYFMRKPMIVLPDPNLVKHVLQSDFASFRNGRKINEKADPLMAKNPFFIHDLEAWRNSRARIVSHLSGKKLSHLIVIAQNVCAKMMNFIERRLGESRDTEYEVELKKTVRPIYRRDGYPRGGKTSSCILREYTQPSVVLKLMLVCDWDSTDSGRVIPPTQPSWTSLNVSDLPSTSGWSRS
ncbi:unnamed protein product [Trichogramma brassicae]|uniref:Cytochrome P450 n=1 Tax=Trichogramma brassicae TaxID=86971 RepID=A0A6H5IBJ1_9HYME|nr:unnamed protein product [Trichogramma brassicae]